MNEYSRDMMVVEVKEYDRKLTRMRRREVINCGIIMFTANRKLVSHCFYE